jgi:hypothetical protein
METAKPSRTKVKAVRLDTDLIIGIGRVAKRHQVSENAYVTRVLRSALTIDSLIPAFNGIGLSSETFASILTNSNSDLLELDGFALGKKHFEETRELLESVGMKMTFVRFLVEILDKQGNWFVVEGNPTEDSESLALRHKYGAKWSLFLKSYLSGAYEVLQAGRLQVQVKESILKIRFPNRPQLKV